MNTANLQLEGLYLAFAAINDLLVRKGLVSAEELDAALRGAEETALNDRIAGELSSANREAIAFPLRLLRLAQQCTEDGKPLNFRQLAKRIGESKNEPSTL